MAAAVAGACLLTAAPMAYSQTQGENRNSSGEAENAVEKILSESRGTIIIDIPPSIMRHLMENPVQPKKTGPRQPVLHKGINKLSGYRVQIFSDGRNQTTLETRAKARGNAVAARFPKYRGQIYTFSSSPNWYCRIGNFQTEQEASAALAELKRAFPAFGGEMRIVRSPIVVIK